MAPQDEDEIEVRSLRRQEWFWIDNVVVKTYQRIIGPTAFSTYATLACLVDYATQETRIKQRHLCEIVGISKPSLRTALEVLEIVGLIQREERFLEGEKNGAAFKRRTSDRITLLPPNTTLEPDDDACTAFRAAIKNRVKRPVKQGVEGKNFTTASKGVLAHQEGLDRPSFQESGRGKNFYPRLTGGLARPDALDRPSNVACIDSLIQDSQNHDLSVRRVFSLPPTASTDSRFVMDSSDMRDAGCTSQPCAIPPLQACAEGSSERRESGRSDPQPPCAPPPLPPLPEPPLSPVEGQRTRSTATIAQAALPGTGARTKTTKSLPAGAAGIKEVWWALAKERTAEGRKAPTLPEGAMGFKLFNQSSARLLGLAESFGWSEEDTPQYLRECFLHQFNDPKQEEWWKGKPLHLKVVVDRLPTWWADVKQPQLEVQKREAVRQQQRIDLDRALAMEAERTRISVLRRQEDSRRREEERERRRRDVWADEDEEIGSAPQRPA